MLSRLRCSLPVQLGVIPALSVLLALLSACTNALETERNYEALEVSTLSSVASDIQAAYQANGAEAAFRYVQNDARVTNVVSFLQDAGLQPELDVVHDAAYEGRLPYVDILEGRDVPMDDDVEAALSALHRAITSSPTIASDLAASGDVGAAREALVWWVVTIIIVVAVAAVAALYSFACAAICRYACAPNAVQSCMGGSVKAETKGAAIGLCNPVCQPPPVVTPPPPPPPPVVVPPPPCPEPSTSQNNARCDAQRQACRDSGGVPIDGSAARCNCTVHCLPGPSTPGPSEPVRDIRER